MGARQDHSLWHHSAKPLLTKQDNAPQREHPPAQQHRLHATALWVETKDPPTLSWSGLILQPINPQAGLLCGAEAAVLIMLKCACVIRLGGGQESRDSVPGCWHQSPSCVYSQLAWGPQKQNIVSFCACVLLMFFQASTWLQFFNCCNSVWEGYKLFSSRVLLWAQLPLEQHYSTFYWYS